jgi:hypothetical protein
LAKINLDLFIKGIVIGAGVGVVLHFLNPGNKFGLPEYMSFYGYGGGMRFRHPHFHRRFSPMMPMGAYGMPGQMGASVSMGGGPGGGYSYNAPGVSISQGGGPGGGFSETIGNMHISRGGGPGGGYSVSYS